MGKDSGIVLSSMIALFSSFCGVRLSALPPGQLFQVHRDCAERCASEGGCFFERWEICCGSERDWVSVDRICLRRHCGPCFAGSSSFRIGLSIHSSIRVAPSSDHGRHRSFSGFRCREGCRHASTMRRRALQLLFIPVRQFM